MSVRKMCIYSHEIGNGILAYYRGAVFLGGPAPDFWPATDRHVAFPPLAKEGNLAAILVGFGDHMWVKFGQILAQGIFGPVGLSARVGKFGALPPYGWMLDMHRLGFRLLSCLWHGLGTGEGVILIEILHKDGLVGMTLQICPFLCLLRKCVSTRTKLEMAY